MITQVPDQNELKKHVSNPSLSSYRIGTFKCRVVDQHLFQEDSGPDSVQLNDCEPNSKSRLLISQLESLQPDPSQNLNLAPQMNGDLDLKVKTQF